MNLGILMIVEIISQLASFKVFYFNLKSVKYIFESQLTLSLCVCHLVHSHASDSVNLSELSSC